MGAVRARRAGPGNAGMERPAGHPDRRVLRHENGLPVAPGADGDQPRRAQGPPRPGEREPVLDHEAGTGRYVQVPWSPCSRPQPRSDLPGDQHSARPEREDHPGAPGGYAGQDQEWHLPAPRNHHDPAEVLDSRRLPRLCAGRPGAGNVGGARRQARRIRRRDRRHLCLLHRLSAGRIVHEGLLRRSGNGPGRWTVSRGAHGPVGTEHHARRVRPRSPRLAREVHAGSTAHPGSGGGAKTAGRMASGPRDRPRADECQRPPPASGQWS